MSLDPAPVWFVQWMADTKESLAVAQFALKRLLKKLEDRAP